MPLKEKRKGKEQPLTTDPNQLDVDGLSVRLLRYVRKRMASREADLVLAEGEGADDVAAEAIASLFGGSRRWDPTREPDPWLHVTSVANGLISNLRRSSDAKTMRGIEDDQVADGVTPETMLLDRERQAWAKKANDLLFERIIDDEDLVKMHDLVENESLERPAELAARLGWPRNRVYRANERLQRHWRQIIDTLSREQKESVHG